VDSRRIDSHSRTFQLIPGHSRTFQDVNIGKDDYLQNFCNKEDQTMNGNVAWPGPREKSREFMQMLIEGTTVPGDVVMDYTASTGLVS